MFRIIYFERTKVLRQNESFSLLGEQSVSSDLLWTVIWIGQTGLSYGVFVNKSYDKPLHKYGKCDQDIK